MSEDIEMMDSFPSITPSKRKGEIDLQEFGQGHSNSVGEEAEPVQKRRRVESDDAAGDLSTLEAVDEPSAQPGAPLGEDAEELQGNLVIPTLSILSGGYANIYLGIWRSPEGTLTDVAVKILKPIRPTSMSCRPDPVALQQRREKRLKREVAVWTRLVHPNVHPLLGFKTRPEPCLVSPWCQNGNLANYLDNNPNLLRPEKIQLLVQVARGLAFLHSQSPPICHADIKPENVLVNDLCEAALSDFGLSRVIQGLDTSTGFTTADGAKGSHKYMAPELFEEEIPKSTLETDVYAFGGLTLAVMSGSPPFAQISAPAKVMRRIIQGEYPKPEEHPRLQQDDPFWPLMLQCWAHEPHLRPIMKDLEVELRKRKTPDVLDHTSSPLQVQVIPEPDIVFDGLNADRCCDLIREVWTYAWKTGKHVDKRWIAEFAATRFAKGVITWYSGLPLEVKYDWDRLLQELIEAYGPRSPDASNHSSIVHDPWGDIARSSSQSTTSSLMPIIPNSTGLLSPPIIPHGSFETNGNGGRVSPDPLHIGLPPSPLPTFKCLHPPGPLNSSTQWQYGRLRVADYTDRLHYVALDLNTLGGCETTTKRHEALCVRVRLGTCRVLYLDNCPPPYDALGVTWDMSKRHTPHLNRGSTDRANLVFLDKENSSSARVFRGRSKDTVWTIKQDNTVRVSWPDENNNDHELHVVVKGESMWSWPGRISLVADVDAFMTRHHGYVRSTLIFEPMT